MTFNGGRLDWAAVKETFRAEIVQIVNEGVPACLQAGERTGLEEPSLKFIKKDC